MQKSEIILTFIGLIVIPVLVIILVDGLDEYFIYPNTPHTTFGIIWNSIVIFGISYLLIYKLSDSWLKLIGKLYV